MSEQRIVYCPIHETSLVEMLAIAREARRRREVAQYFFLHNPRLMSERSTLEDAGMEVVVFSPDESGPFSPKPLLERVLTAFLARGFTPPRWLLEYGLELFRTAKYFDVAISKALARIKPTAVALPDDRTFSHGFLPAVMHHCARINIPSIIVPISIPGDLDSLLRLSSRKQNALPDGHWLIRRFGNQVRLDPELDRQVSFYPIVQTLLLKQRDWLPQNPWAIGGGFSTRVLAEGALSQTVLLEAGCPQQKIRITGHRSHDVIYNLQKRRQQVRSALFPDCGDQPILVISLPQLGEHNLLPWDRHWEEIHFLCDSVSDWRHTVVISLHPKMKREQYQFVEDNYGLHITDQPLREVLPAADLFIATFSSTVQWAILCRTPSIVVDFYGFGYSTYDDIAGIAIETDKQAYCATLRQLLENATIRKERQMLLANYADQISPFDGKCTDRIIESLIDRNPVVAGQNIPDPKS